MAKLSGASEQRGSYELTMMASMRVARSGMWEASARFATSATKVAEAGLARWSVTEVDSQAPVANAVPPLGVNLPAEMVIQRLAQHQLQANLTSYRTADSMVRSVIDIIA